MNPVPDTELQAFARLVELHHTAVHAVAYAITRDVTIADDVAQQAFVAAWTARGTLRDPAKVRPWLCGIARNQSHKALRRIRRERVASNVIVAALASDAASPDTRDTRDALLAQEAERHVQSVLAAMPARYREPLVLFYWQDQSIAHVATTLAITEQAAQKRISRGREYLRDGLASLETDLATVARRRRAASAAAAAVLAAIGMRSAHAASIAPRASYVAHGLRTLAACGVGAIVMYAALVPRDLPACPTPPAPTPVVGEDLERQLQQLRRDVVRIQFEDNAAHDELRAQPPAAVVATKPASKSDHAASKQVALSEPTHVASEPVPATERAAPPASPPVEVVATCERLDCVLAGPSDSADGAAQCCKAVMSHFRHVSSGVAGISKLQPDGVVADANEVCKLVRDAGQRATRLVCEPKK